MTITAERTPPAPVDLVDEPPTCEHRGCQSAEPTNPGLLFPGGPLRPAAWGGAGAGPARLDGPPCPDGLSFCCGLCGCGGE